MPKCSKCGTSYGTEDVYCPSCGEKVKTITPKGSVMIYIIILCFLAGIIFFLFFRSTGEKQEAEIADQKVAEIIALEHFQKLFFNSPYLNTLPGADKSKAIIQMESLYIKYSLKQGKDWYVYLNTKTPPIEESIEVVVKSKDDIILSDEILVYLDTACVDCEEEPTTFPSTEPSKKQPTGGERVIEAPPAEDRLAEYLPQTCTVEAGIVCNDWKITSTEFKLLLLNSLGRDLINVDIAGTTCSAKDAQADGSAADTWNDGEELIVTLTGCGNPPLGALFEETLTISYTDKNGFNEVKTGNIRGRVE